MALLIGSGVEVDNEALAVKIGNVIAGNLDTVIGVILGLQIERQGGVSPTPGALSR